jgi:hypothetical protein
MRAILITGLYAKYFDCKIWVSRTMNLPETILTIRYCKDDINSLEANPDWSNAIKLSDYVCQ